MTNTFLPQGYEKPASNSNYFKLEEGNNKFRILSSAIVGWLDWDDKKPVRTKERPEHLFDATKPAKHFWAFIVWDYKDGRIKIMEITQATIQDAILTLHNDAGWGNPVNYDINIVRKGKDKETKYNVLPTPPKQISEEINKLYQETNINLNALFVGGDPFSGEKKEIYDNEQPQEGHIEDFNVEESTTDNAIMDLPF
jgi:hypothetical protein